MKCTTTKLANCKMFPETCLLPFSPERSSTSLFLPGHDDKSHDVPHPMSPGSWAGLWVRHIARPIPDLLNGEPQGKKPIENVTHVVPKLNSPVLLRQLDSLSIGHGDTVAFPIPGIPVHEFRRRIGEIFAGFYGPAGTSFGRRAALPRLGQIIWGPWMSYG